MHIEFLLVLSLAYWTEQHLIFPVNYCHMAVACMHDNRMVCASSPDGCSRRNFLDQCDMYEYNCDYGTRYEETYSKYCETDNLDGNRVDPETKPKYEPSTESLLVTQASNVIQTAEDINDYVEAKPITTAKNIQKSPTILTTILRRSLESIDSLRQDAHKRLCDCIVKCLSYPTCTPVVTMSTISIWITSAKHFLTLKPTITQLCLTHKHPTEPCLYTQWSMSWSKPCISVPTCFTRTLIPTTIASTTLSILVTTTIEKTTPPTITSSVEMSLKSSLSKASNLKSIPTSQHLTSNGNCCNRPLTWLTTTENPIPITFTHDKPIDHTNTKILTQHVTVSESLDKTDHVTYTITKTPTTESSLTTITQRTPKTFRPLSIIPAVTLSKSSFSKTSPDMQSASLHSTENGDSCNMPSTWLTTTTIPLTVTFIPEAPIVHTTTETNMILTKRTFQPSVTTKRVTFTKTKATTIQDLPTTETQIMSKKYPDIIILHSHPSNRDEVMVTTPKARKPMKINTASDENKKESLKLFETSTLWYPSLCPSNRCQRPLTWIVTKPKPRRRWRN